MDIKFTYSNRGPLAKLNVSGRPPYKWIWDDPENYSGKTIRDRARSYFERCRPLIKELRPEGVVFWDIEREYEDGKYVGSPDKADKINPDFAPYFDEFIGWFKNELNQNIGFNIRPQEFNLKTRRQQESSDPLATMIRKCKAMIKRCDARLFYIDSNVFPDPWTVYPGMMFAWLHRALGDERLIIPEHKFDWTTYLFSAGWGELIYGAGPPPDVLDKVPNAFSVVNISTGDIPGQANVIRDSMRRGTKVIIDLWWRSPQVQDALTYLFS